MRKNESFLLQIGQIIASYFCLLSLINLQEFSRSWQVFQYDWTWEAIENEAAKVECLKIDKGGGIVNKS